MNAKINSLRTVVFAVVIGCRSSSSALLAAEESAPPAITVKREID